VKYVDNCVSVTTDGEIVPGLSRDPSWIEVPSTTHLLGGQFNDPTIGAKVKEFPLPVYEHPVSHTCVIDADGTPVTPEGMMAAILNGVKEEASRSVNEPVVDTSIAVPTLFTSAQRAALRDAGESVGLRIAHVASGTLVAARAMKIQGDLVEPGPSLIVDVGASKTEVSLIHNSSSGIREVKTVGSDSIGTNAVRDRLVNLCMSTIGGERHLDSRLQVQVQKAVQKAMDDTRDRRVVIKDLGFSKVISKPEFERACEPVANRMGELLRDVLPLPDGTSIKHVGYTGGGTNIPQFRKVTELACPSAKQHQLNPGKITVSGAALDAALQTSRLDRTLQMSVTGVVPYSIGIELTGGVVKHVIQRGETLPAIGEGTNLTTTDGQTSAAFSIYQGEHYLAELGDLIGTSELTGLTPLPRAECQVVCRIEYDKNGILQFSAREANTGKSVSATFTAKTEFTEADRSRLHSGSEADLLAEARLASLRYVRKLFILDVERAEKQKGTDEFSAATEKWRRWIDSHLEGKTYMFLQTRYQMQTEFQRLNPKDWETIDELTPDLQFQAIYPTGPSFVNEGCAILRFLSTADCPKVNLCTTLIATKEMSREAEILQFPVGGKIETVARICFPASGKYDVTAFLGTADETMLHPAMELSYTQYVWRIDVSGVPATKRRLCQLIPGQPFMPLKCPDTFRIEPSASCVRIPGTAYTFTCTFLGKELGINGREPEGEDKQTFFAATKVLPKRGGWKSEECTLECPAEGVWRVVCWVDDDQVCSQTIIAGSTSYLSPTYEEKSALSAPYPRDFRS
jgi:molecular chaperone DnaK (HSP70)